MLASRVRVSSYSGVPTHKASQPTPAVRDSYPRKVAIPVMKNAILATLLLAVCGAAAAQTVQPLAHQPPNGAGIAFLLTDGTVLAQGNSGSDWWKLTPDNKGSYVNGTWAQMASLPSGYAPDAFASAVLADGRLVIEGGEYNNGNFLLTNLGAIYDPKTNKWTAMKPPTGWKTIGDSPSSMLPDGSYIVGQKLTTSVAKLNPKTLTWTVLPSSGKNHFNSEEGWTLMPTGSILTADVKNAPNSEFFTPATAKWTSAGSTIVDLHSPTTIVGCLPFPGGCYYPPGEIGPQILRPDGTVFVAGGTPKGGTFGHTAVYHPSTKAWVVGPNFPTGDDAGDSSAVLLPSGNVLVAGNSGTLYEFNGTTLKPTRSGVGAPVLILPSGQALVEGFNLAVYNATGTVQAGWKPVIKTAPSAVTHGMTYAISGTQFNGLSQAAAFGDEFETATNYPLVRITNNSSKHVFYAKTHDHTSMGVATGSLIVTTNFDVPFGIETGLSTLVVVANGIASAPMKVTVN